MITFSKQMFNIKNDWSISALFTICHRLLQITLGKKIFLHRTVFYIPNYRLRIESLSGIFKEWEHFKGSSCCGKDEGTWPLFLRAWLLPHSNVWRWTRNKISPIFRKGEVHWNLSFFCPHYSPLPYDRKCSSWGGVETQCVGALQYVFRKPIRNFSDLSPPFKLLILNS